MRLTPERGEGDIDNTVRVTQAVEPPDMAAQSHRQISAMKKEQAGE